MDSTEKKNTYQLLFQVKKEILEKSIKQLEPGLYDVLHDNSDKLLHNKIDEIVNYIKEKCNEFNGNEKHFASMFVKVSLNYLEETCKKSEFNIISIHKLIDTVERVEIDRKCTFEFLLEYTLKDKKRKLSDHLTNDIHTLLHMCNEDFISEDFQKIMHKIIDEWSQNILVNMLTEEHYEKACRQYSILIKELQKGDILKRVKVQRHYEEGGLFKLVKTIRYHNNPNYDYSDIEGKFVKFLYNPTTCALGVMNIYLDGLDKEPHEWFTTHIVERNFDRDEFVLRTLNTAYCFEIFDDSINS